MSRFADPDWDGDGLAVVVEHTHLFGGHDRIAPAIAARWPRAQLIAGWFRDEPVHELVPACVREAHKIELSGRRRHYLAPRYARRMARAVPVAADIVLALHSSGWAAAINTAPGVSLVAYTAGPPRAMHRNYGAYLSGYPAAIRPLVIAALPALRAHQARLMRRCDLLLAPSRWAAAELSARTGGSTGTVHPPVRVHELSPSERRPEGPVIAVARLEPQKRIGAVVEAFRGLDRDLVVAGTGRLLEPLRRAAPSNVEFTGLVSDAELTRLYQSASALVCPTVEEFGIVMAEAHACGVPVVAPRAGGALDIVEDGRTGLLVDDASPAGLREAVGRLDDLDFDRDAARRSAERFSEDRFIRRLVLELERAAYRRPRTDASQRVERYAPLPESVG
ncbi:MAG: glycosyltransferase [Solirubrobacterales bacterium]